MYNKQLCKLFCDVACKLLAAGSDYCVLECPGSQYTSSCVWYYVLKQASIKGSLLTSRVLYMTGSDMI